jgi:hypothetical protein
MHGPTGPRWDALVVPTVDAVRQTLPAVKRGKWDKLLRRALRAWSPAGVTFDVTVHPTGIVMDQAEFTGAITPGAYVIGRSTPGLEDVTWFDVTASQPQAVTTILIDKLNARSFDLILRIVCHEAGHALGLGHQVGSPTSVMWKGDWPNQHDLDSINYDW